MKTKTTIYAKKTALGNWSNWTMFKHGSSKKTSVENLSRVLRNASTLIDDREHVVAVKIEISRKK